MLPLLHAGPAPWTWVSGVQTLNNSSGLALQAVCVPLFTGPIARARIETIRAATGYGQGTFAATIGVSVRTLQGWEQGRRKPSGPARALLAIIAHDPEAYARAAAAAIAAATSEAQ